MKKHTITLLLLAAILLGAGGYCYYELLMPQFFPAEKTYIYIDRDDTADSVFHKLRERGKARSLAGAGWIAAYKGYRENIHTGRYEIRTGENSISVMRRLINGHQTPLQLTVPSVRSIEKLAKRFGNKLMMDSAEIAHLLTDSAELARIGYNPRSILSLPIPNTYEVYWDIAPAKLVERLKKEHDIFWNAARKAKADSIGFTPEEVATLASIVAEESNNLQEKPLIAGLYINRLQKGMFLQADPTVRYAVYDFNIRRISHQDLKEDSPYNTYKHKGLPPGPIRIAAPADIDAVLNHARHNYLYMCAKEDFSGTHNFAATFAEHKANARKYWKELNRRNIHRTSSKKDK